MGGPTPKDWVHPDERPWNLWVEYCEKVSRWYSFPERPELEPWGMNPPCESIVRGTIYAAQNLTSCRMELDKIIEVLKENSGGKGIGIPHLYLRGLVMENEALKEEIINLRWQIRKEGK